MATTRLTQARIEALRPRKASRIVRDASLKGFGIRVYPTGHSRFTVRSLTGWPSAVRRSASRAALLHVQRGGLSVIMIAEIRILC